MSSKTRNRRGLHVVKPRNENPVEEEKSASGVNVKQLVFVGAITALTGTVVGAVATELYRYFRRKVPIPPPDQPQANPALPPWMQAPIGPVQPHPSGFPPMPQQQFSPMQAVQQIGAFPQQPQPNYGQMGPYPYGSAPPALPPPPAQNVALPSAQPQAEPLSRPELAQWQRGLETWQRDLERRETIGRPTSSYDPRDR